MRYVKLCIFITKLMAIVNSIDKLFSFHLNENLYENELSNWIITIEKIEL